jgi:hypothetical protein
LELLRKTAQKDSYGYSYNYGYGYYEYGNIALEVAIALDLRNEVSEKLNC